MRSGGDSLPIGGIFLIFNVGGRAKGSYLWQAFMFMQAIVKKKKKKKIPLKIVPFYCLEF